MDLRKSWRVWLVAGCGCVVAGAVVVGALGLLFSLWPKPFGPHTPPKSGAVDSYEKERSRTLESVLGEANAAVGRRGRNLHRGQLDHTRDVTLRCGDGLTVAIRAGTFDAPLPVRVDAMEVARDHVAPGDTVLAAFDVKVGAGGPLRQPVHLTVSHAAVRDDDDVLAGRWDEQKAQWVALPVVRRSPTSSEVTTDHLSTLVVTSSPLWMSDRYQVLGSRFTLYLEKGVVPDPELLYKWPADEVLSSGPALLARRQRFQKAADQYGFTDTTLASKRRYTDTVSRVVFAAVMEGLLTSIANEYERRGFGPPPSVRVFIGTYDSPQWVTLSIGHRINIPANQGLESPELLAVNLAHELFHACQGQSGLSLARMLHDKWVVEAMAEYASTRVAWGSGRSNAFGEAGVVLDGGTVQAQMGDGITPRFIEDPLLSTAGDGPYLGAHFVEYLVSRAPGAGFEGLYRKLVAGAGGLTGGSSEDIVAGFAADNGLVLSEVYADFVAHLVLDPKSPARAGASPTATPGAAPAPLESRTARPPRCFDTELGREAVHPCGLHRRLHQCGYRAFGCSWPGVTGHSPHGEQCKAWRRGARLQGAGRGSGSAHGGGPGKGDRDDFSHHCGLLRCPRREPLRRGRAGRRREPRDLRSRRALGPRAGRPPHRLRAFPLPGARCARWRCRLRVGLPGRRRRLHSRALCRKNVWRSGRARSSRHRPHSTRRRRRPGNSQRPDQRDSASRHRCCGRRDGPARGLGSTAL